MNESVRTVGRRSRLLALWAGALGLCLAAAGPAAPIEARADGGSVTCQNYMQSGTVPAATVPGGQPLAYSIFGELCATPGELRDGTTVQLLVHGATYNHTYWDFPGTFTNPTTYSYARDAAAQGYPTFAIDQIGAGLSTKPEPSTRLDINVAAFVDHQAIQGLKDGSITGTRFGKVILVGHSQGSAAAWAEAITYPDADGLIATGLVHHASAFLTGQFVPGFYPAIQDPRFQNLPPSSPYFGIDAGYVTTMPPGSSPPGIRALGFYDLGPNADPAVIAADEASKDIVSATEQNSTGVLFGTATLAIRVPVLIVMGDHDALFCGPSAQGVPFDCSSGSVIVREEAPLYSAPAQLRACSVPSSSHDISLHRNHAIQVTDLIAWSNTFVGQSQDGNNQGGNSQGQDWPPPGCS